MKKVRLVGDEVLIRETIRECIQWEEEGMVHDYCLMPIRASDLIQLLRHASELIDIEAIQLGASLSLDLQARYYVVMISDDRNFEDKPLSDTGVASQIENNPVGQYVFLDRTRFVNFLKVGSPSQLSSFIEEYASALNSINWVTSPIGYYLLNDLTLEVFRSAKDMYRHWDMPEDALQQLQQMITKVRSIDEAIQYLISLTNQFWSWRSQTNDKYGEMLRSVKTYIHSNYSNDTFSLQDAAEHVRMSSSHLSKVFSQETGRTFIEYLTQYRISKAMELFKTTSYKSFEIACLVGYNDPHYFSTLFKRITGMTTKEFKKSGGINTTLVYSSMEWV